MPGMLKLVPAVLFAISLCAVHVQAQTPVVAPIAIIRTNWTVTADSVQSGQAVANVLDGSKTTYWQSVASPAAALPHNITIDMRSSYYVSGLSYLPRQGSGANGNIGQHTILVSSDGTTWTSVSAGTWLNDSDLKTSYFSGKTARYIRLMAQSDASGATSQLSSAAEINVLSQPKANLARTNWVVSADSSEPGPRSYLPADAIDNAVTSYWHSQFSGTVPKLPHYFNIDQGSAKTVAGLTYLPRPSSTGKNGIIGQYRVDRSTDNSTWTSVITGTWPDDSTLKTVEFAPVSARYFRLVALTEAGNRGQFASASEINLLDGSTQLSSFTITVDSQELTSANCSGVLALDSNPSTFWHTPYSGTTLPGYPHTLTIDLLTPLSVHALTYTPRQDGSPNGRIGAHEIAVSTDGATWTRVAKGTFWDTPLPSLVAFGDTVARYVRLTALSEAGGRGPWASAGEITLGFDSALAAPPHTAGQWGATIDFPTVPVAAALVAGSGKVLTWSSYLADRFTGGSGSGKTITATYDPADGSVTQAVITNTQHDMFCPGISVDFLGRPWVTGGNDAQRASLYALGNESWIAAPDMKIARGYQSQATLSDGRIFTVGGSWSGGRGGKNGEAFDPKTNSWGLLPGCPVAPMLTKDAGGIFRQDNHGWFFSWSNATVFQAGPSSAMNWYTTTGGGGVKGAGKRASDPDSMNGNAVMFDAVKGMILTAGGAPDYQDAAATGNVHLITIGAPNTTASVTQLTSMSYKRSFANGIALPDGKVLILGGQSYAEPFYDDEPTLHPELWDPVTKQWTILAAQATPRTYHSIALLMPDATIISGGGGLCGDCSQNHFDAQIFQPPYLFNSDGSLATRPTIQSVTSTNVTIGGSFTATTGGAVSSFSLIRMGSATHTVNTDQRRIALNGTSAGTNQYQFTLPADPGVALPGYWMLFAVSAGGVPSVATTIKVNAS